MKKLLFLCISISFISWLSLQGFKFSGNLEKDMKFLFPEGPQEYAVFGGVEYDDKVSKLLEKMIVSVKENEEWFLKALSITKEGEGLPYDKRMGITLEEHNYIKNNRNKIRVIETGRLKYNIKRADSLIKFIPEDTLIHKTITLNTNKNILKVGLETIPFKDTITISSTSNAFSSSWKGYQWLLETPSDIEMSDISNIYSMDIRQVKVTMGYMFDLEKTYLSIESQSSEQGTIIENYKARLLSVD